MQPASPAASHEPAHHSSLTHSTSASEEEPRQPSASVLTGIDVEKDHE
jgi:hypothetical protein